METAVGNCPSIMKNDLFSEGDFLLDCQVHNIPLEQACIKQHCYNTSPGVFSSGSSGSPMHWGANYVL